MSSRARPDTSFSGSPVGDAGPGDGLSSGSEQKVEASNGRWKDAQALTRVGARAGFGDQAASASRGTCCHGSPRRTDPGAAPIARRHLSPAFVEIETLGVEASGSMASIPCASKAMRCSSR